MVILKTSTLLYHVQIKILLDCRWYSNLDFLCNAAAIFRNEKLLQYCTEPRGVWETPPEYSLIMRVKTRNNPVSRCLRNHSKDICSTFFHFRLKCDRLLFSYFSKYISTLSRSGLPNTVGRNAGVLLLCHLHWFQCKFAKAISSAKGRFYSRKSKLYSSIFHFSGVILRHLLWS